MVPRSLPSFVTRALLIVLPVVTIAGCDVDKRSILAPDNSTLIVNAATSFLPIGQATTLTVSLRQSNGQPVTDGTEVVLTAVLGELEQRKVRTLNGAAGVTYTAGEIIGVGRVTAYAASNQAEVSIPIGSAPLAGIALSATPASLPPGGGSADITAFARSPQGAPVAGLPVSFTTTAGTLSPSQPVTTDAQGVARVRLTTSVTATVRGNALNLATADVAMPVRPPVTLAVAFTPALPLTGQPVTFTVNATALGQPATGTARMEFGNGQTANLGTITGMATVAHTYALGDFNATAVFVDGFGIEVRSTIRVEVRNPPTTPPPPPPGSGVDEIDPRSITWLSGVSTDVTNWAITSRVTSVDQSGDTVCVYHTKAGQWPLVSIDNNPPNLEGNMLIVVNIGGQWYGATFDWLRQGQTCKDVTAAEYGRDQIRVAPLDASWPGPRAGDMIGLLVSTPARYGVRTINERSNIVLIRWK